MKKRIRQMVAAAIILSGIGIHAPVQAQAKGKMVSLHGALKHFDNQVMIEDMSAYQYLLPPDVQRVIVPDESGHFTIQFPVTAPGYYRLGRNILYLSPGDDMELMIDKANCTIAVFSGKGSAANLYLRNTPFPKAGSFLEAGGNIKETPQATVDIILSMAAARQKQLDTLQQVTAAFKRLETARTKADVINSLQAVNSYARRRGGDTTKNFIAACHELATPVIAGYSKDIKDASLMQLVVYRDIADGIIGPKDDPATQQQVKDWYTSSDLMHDMQKLSDKKLLIAYRDAIGKIKTTGYRDALNTSLDNMLKFGKGDPAVDFTVIDTSGNKILLSSLKGKVIYVDLWATWCGPCMAEMPHFEKLKEKYKDNPAVAFVSLDIQDPQEGWTKSIVRRNAGGYQWLVNRDKLTAYNIVGIPRTLLIDKNFIMVDMNGPLPSSAQTEKAINALLQ